MLAEYGVHSIKFVFQTLNFNLSLSQTNRLICLAHKWKAQMHLKTQNLLVLSEIFRVYTYYYQLLFGHWQIDTDIIVLFAEV